jgi:cell division ATPase FtsA
VEYETLAVVGSRGFKRPDLVHKAIQTFGQCIVVTGGASGVDTYAELAARDLKFRPVRVIKPLWDMHGRAAGLIRNTEIIKESNYVMAFWDNVSRGTFDSITKARQYRKPLLLAIGVDHIQELRLEIWNGEQQFIRKVTAENPQTVQTSHDQSEKQGSLFTSDAKRDIDRSEAVFANHPRLCASFRSILPYLHS